MKYLDNLASYLPSLIVSHLMENDTTSHPPQRQSYNTVCVFADVSGFTALSEAMAKFGTEGAEHLAKHLNSYFGQMVKLIASEGGDIFKFAGDAMIVLWPDNEDIQTRIRRAGQCALAIQENLHRAELADGVMLSVKIGIGVGMVSVLHLGGRLSRMEYVAVGEPLVQAFGAEHHCTGGGEVIMSPSTWSHVSEFFEVLEELEHGFIKLKSVLQPLRRVSKMQMLKASLDEAEHAVEKRVQCYVAAAATLWLNPAIPDQETWGGDLRLVTVLFVNLGLKNHDLLAAAQYDDAMQRAHRVLTTVQDCVYQYEGSVNKFLMDDKGSTLIAVFGLPPLAHEDDATRGVLAGMAICDKLWDFRLAASVGITTGVVFCGVVGSTTRKEYSVLGDTVNLSARLMQQACGMGGGVLVDRQIVNSANSGIEFQQLGTIKVKGKSMAIEIFHPYPRGGGLPTTLTAGATPSPYKTSYQMQLENVMAYSLMRPHAAPATASNTYKAEDTKDDPTATGPGAARRRASTLTGNAGGAAGASLGAAAASARRTSASAAAGVGTRFKRMRFLSTKAIPPYSFATLPYIKLLSVFVPTDFCEADALTRSINYGFLTPLSKHVPCEEDDTPTLQHMLQAVVSACRAQGRIPDTMGVNEFALQISGSEAVLPTSDLPIVYMSVYAVESGAVTAAVRDGILRVTLVKRRDLAQLQSNQQRLQLALAENKILLLAKNQGVAMMVEGEAGVGKTHVLQHFVMNVMPNKCTTFSVRASPYQRATPYAVWSELLTAYFEEVMATARLDSPTEAMMHILKKAGVDNRLLALCSVLNKPLGLSLPSSVAVSKLRKDQREGAVRALLFELIKSLATEFPAVILIDDGFNMDPASWDLAHRIAAAAALPAGSPHALKLMLVISTRIVPHYLDVVSKATPTSYSAMHRATWVQHHSIVRLAPQDARTLIAAVFKVKNVDSGLYEYVDEQTCGNPLFVAELCNYLKERNFVSIEESGGATPVKTVKLLPTFDKAVPPVCPLTEAILGMRMDRLHLQQQLLLKVAALIGREFKFSALFTTFPLDEFKPSLQVECDMLAQQGLLKPVSIVVAGQSEHELGYVFTSAAMFRLVSSHMLLAHREKLKRLIEEQMEQQNAARRKVYLEKMMAVSAQQSSTMQASKSGWVSVRKNVDNPAAAKSRFGFGKMLASEWKERWLVISGDTIRMYKEESEESKGVEPVQIIPLEGATAEILPADDLKKDFCFRLDSAWWIKKGTRVNEHRVFFLSCSSQTEADGWVDWIKFFADKLKNPSQQTRGRKKSVDLSKEDEDVDLEEEPDMNDGTLSPTSRLVPDSSLLATVVKADGLILSKAYGLANPRADIRVGSAVASTTPAKKTSAPTWRASLKVPLTFGDVVPTVVRVSVWDQDDDIGALELGAVEIPVHSLLNSTGEVVYTLLEPTSLTNDFYRGTITVAFTLECSEAMKAGLVSQATATPVSPLVAQEHAACGDSLDWLSALRSVHVTTSQAVASGGAVSENGGAVASPSLLIEADMDEDPAVALQSAMRRIAGLAKLLGATDVHVSDDEDSGDENLLDDSDEALFEDSHVLQSPEMAFMRTQMHVLASLLKSCRKSVENAGSAVSFATLLAQCELPEASKAWLTSVFSTESAPAAGGAPANVAGRSGAGWQVDMQANAPTEEQFLPVYYQDLAGALQGPFSCEQVRGWYHDEYLPAELLVRVGETGDFLPLSSQLQHINANVVGNLIRLARRLFASGNAAYNVHSWQFDVRVLEADSQECLALVTYMFAALKLDRVFNMTASAFIGFLESVRDSMALHGLSYHNFLHAVDSAQVCFKFLQGGANRLLTAEEQGVLMIAALTHDLEHPGLNNAYQVSACTDLAVRFNDQSVLENHHCLVLFGILQEHNLFAEMPAAQYGRIRRMLIQSVLATDPTHHATATAQLQAFVTSQKQLLGQVGTVDLSDQFSATERHTLVQAMVHATDLVKLCRGTTQARQWLDAMLEEHFCQGDRERVDGLPVSPNMDRETTIPSSVALDLTDFVVGPFMVALVNILPDVAQLCLNLGANRAAWAAEFQQHLAAAEDSSAAVEQLNRRTQAFAQTMDAVSGLAALSRRAGAASTHEATLRRMSVNMLRAFVDTRTTSAAAGSHASSLPGLAEGDESADA